jgi:hypothetical protein
LLLTPTGASLLLSTTMVPNNSFIPHMHYYSRRCTLQLNLRQSGNLPRITCPSSLDMSSVVQCPLFCISSVFIYDSCVIVCVVAQLFH